MTCSAADAQNRHMRQPVVTSPPSPIGLAEEAPFPLAPMQHAYWIGRSDEQELGGVAAHLYVEFDGGAIDPGAAGAGGVRSGRGASDAAHPIPAGRHPADHGRAGSAGVRRGRPARAESVSRSTPRWRQLRDRKTHQRLAIEDGQVIDITLTLRDEEPQPAAPRRRHAGGRRDELSGAGFRAGGACTAGRRCPSAGLQLPSLPHRAPARNNPRASGTGIGGTSGCPRCPARPNCRPCRSGIARRRIAPSATTTGWHRTPNSGWWPEPTSAESRRPWRWRRSSPTRSAAGRRRAGFC